MFDDLHDPAPPSAGLDTLASVSARAKAIRRRRVVMTGGGVAAVAALVIGAVVVAGRPEPAIVPASPDGALFADPALLYLDLAESAELPRCAGGPLPPPWLEDGSLPGQAIDDQVTVGGETYRTVRWGSGDVAVHQFEDSDLALWPERAMPPFAATSSDPVPFIEVPGGIPGTRHVRIVDEPGGCRRDYLVGEMRLGVGLNVGTWTLQEALARQGLDAVDRAEWGICATIAGEDAVCLPDQTFDRDLETGVGSAGYELLTGATFGSVDISEYDGVGVFHVLVGADDVVAPLSRHAVEVPIAGTRLKSVVDLTLSATAHCVVVTSPSGERSTVAAQAPVLSDGIVESPALDCEALVGGLGAPVPDITEPSITATVPSTDLPDADPCRDVPAPPAWLVDGSSPGEATIATAPDGSMSARWGVEGSAKAVSQSAPDPSAGWFEIVAGTDQLVTAGQARAAVVPVGDGAIGMIRIAVSDESCDREYLVGPGVELEDAIAFAQDWVDALAAWDSLTLSASSGEICLSVDGASPPDCVPEDFAGQYYSRRLDGTSLWVVLHVAREGEESWVVSSVSRSMSVAGDPALEVRVDIVRSCGATESPDSTVQPWGFGCSSVTPIGPSSDPAAVRSDVVAIDGNGDAVVFDGSAEPSVIFDGTDPDDPLPPEGPVTFIDGVAVAPDGQIVVGVCCEPSAGALWAVDPASGTSEFLTYGHMPRATPSGSLLWEGFGPVSNGGFDGGVGLTVVDLDPDEWRVLDLAAVQRTAEHEEVLVLADRSDGTYLIRVFSGGGDMRLTRKISDAPWTEDPEFSLAGWSDRSFLVLDRGNRILREYGAEQLDIQPAGDGQVDWISAWFTPDTSRYVTAERRLFVDEIEVPGEYIWVR